MQYANLAEFNEPTSRLDANGGLLPPYSLQNGGILNPRIEVIAIGTRLVRFDNGGEAHDPEMALGRWWLLERQYFRIAGEARGYGSSIPWMVREMCAVLKEWGDMTVRFTAVVRKPLLCYRGKGAPASKGVVVEFDARMAEEMRIEQFFIPGMQLKHVFDSAMAICGSPEFIPHENSLMPFLVRKPVT